jgi:hypothetical protein
MRGMTLRFPYGVGSAGVALAVLCIVLMPACGQDTPGQGAKKPIRIAGDFDKVHLLPPGGPTPRMPDGHPDLSGLWYPNSAGRMLQFAEPVDPSIIRQFDPKVTPEEKPVFKPGVNPTKGPATYTRAGCGQAGTPSTALEQISQHAAMELVQVPGKLVMLFEYPMDIRIIRTDGHPHQKDPDPTFNGDSTVRWDGDTMVIDVLAIDERLRNQGPFLSGLSNPTLPGGTPAGEETQGGGGWFHSAQEHVVERLSRTSKNYLTYQVTIEDPLVLAKPWKSAPRVWSLASDPNDSFSEVFCTHDEEPTEMKKIRAYEEQTKGK